MKYSLPLLLSLALSSAHAQNISELTAAISGTNSLQIGREIISPTAVRKVYSDAQLKWQGGSSLNARFYELLEATAQHGIPSSIFWNASDETTAFSLLQNNQLTSYDIFYTWKTIRLARALQQGMVLPEKMSAQVKYKNKETTTQTWAQVSAYLNGQLSARQLVEALTPQTNTYRQLLKVYQRLDQYPLNDSSIFPTVRTNILKVGRATTATSSLALQVLTDRLDFQGYSVNRQTTVFDSALSEVIKKFQFDHGLGVDGVVGGQVWDRVLRTKEELRTQVAVNLDRQRWLPQVFEAENVRVNLAKQHLVYTKDSVEAMAFVTVNGRVDRKTPLMKDSISFAEINPTWTVPYNILVKDKLSVLREDPKKIYEWKMKVYDDLSGREVSPDSINWNRISPSNLTYTLVQSPGPHNALGKVKFPMENPWAIYLHDTNSPHLFAESDRLLSSGCVRMSQPLEFAERVINQPVWSLARLNELTILNPAPQTQKVTLGRKIPVYLMYTTVDTFGENGILFLKDSYAIDQAQYNLWKSL